MVTRITESDIDRREIRFKVDYKLERIKEMNNIIKVLLGIIPLKMLFNTIIGYIHDEYVDDTDTVVDDWALYVVAAALHGVNLISDEVFEKVKVDKDKKELNPELFFQDKSELGTE